MKLGTIVKVGALAVAAGSTAVGTVLVTTKALAKVGGKPQDAPIDTSNGPVINRPFGEEAPVATTPIVEAAPVIEEPAPAPVFEAPVVEAAPFVAEEPIPAPMPVFEAPAPEPVSFATAETAPVVEPVEVKLPEIEVPVVEPVAAPVVEPVAAPVDIGYNLPYMAGNVGTNTELAVGGAPVETPVAEEVVPEPVVEEPAPVVEEVAEPEPIVEEVAPVVEEVAPVAEEPAPELSGLGLINAALADAPVAEPVAVEPVVEEPVVAAEPELVLSSAEPISTEEPVVEAPAPVEEDTLIPQQPNLEVEAPIFAEPAPVVEPVMPEPEVAPVTFETLPISDEYIEEVAPASEPAPAPVEEAPVAEEPAAEEKGKEAKIGDTIVSDKNTNPSIIAVANKFGASIDNLVSIEAAGNVPMVFEFLFPDMRNDATLTAVYFIMNGEPTLPPDADKEGVVAFGREFITNNADLRAFLA